MHCANCVTQKTQWLIFGKRGQPWRSGIVALSGLRCIKEKSVVTEKFRCIRNLELRQKNMWFSWRNLLSENLCCMWGLLLCVDGEFDLPRRLLGSSCRVCMHHAHKHSQCNLFAFVLFVIAKIIGLVVLCFRYQYAKILLLHRVPVSSFLLICCRILRFCNPPMRNIVYK